MRVLFATDHIHFPQGGGGAERNTHELCLALKRRGVEPGVMSSLSPNNTWLSWSNRFRRALLPHHRYPCDKRCGYPVYRGWADDGGAEIMERFRPTVVVVQSTHPDKLLNQFDAHGAPLAAYFHEVAEIDHLASLANRSIQIIANSPFTAARLRSRCGLEPVVVLPLIDPAHYITPTKPERCLFINTVPRKGLDIAFAIAEARPDIQFDFVRSWILNDLQIAELSERSTIAGNITIHSPRRDMRPLYARAKLVLVPSQWEETWGRVATEAQINGIPVLASDRGGLPQAVGPGGVVIAADAPHDAWIAAFTRLWDDEVAYRASSNAAREYARRPEIQPDIVVSALYDILAELSSTSS